MRLLPVILPIYRLSFDVNTIDMLSSLSQDRSFKLSILEMQIERIQASEDDRHER